MNLRYPLPAPAAALALSAGPALAGGLRPADAYLAIAGLAPDGRARAGELRPPEARVVRLGREGASAVVYYTVEGPTFRVVTTLGTDQDGPTCRPGW